MIARGKKYNVAKAAIARKLACFIWGIMAEQEDTFRKGIEIHFVLNYGTA